jgi:NTP pyrophosphatase (non-canonical NTP hydrolase)
MVLGVNPLKIPKKVIEEVMEERQRQHSLWGLQRHPLGKWLGILGEEFGEVCEAINRIHFPKDAKLTDSDNLEEELIQLAAVAVAIVEQLKEEKLGGL